MNIQKIKKIPVVSLIVILGMFSSACSMFIPRNNIDESTPTETTTPTPSLTVTPQPPTSTPTITPSPTWEWQTAGEITCPILLYHHIADINPPTYYYTSISDFFDQMQLLHDLDYTPIPISLLVQAITEGANLPPRPIVITFDDGDEDVYTNAFPIMKNLDFPGVVFIVSNWLGNVNYLGVDEIKEMVSSGWEVGNHSTSHLNLMDNPGQMYDQAATSRVILKNALNLSVDVFAYPFGAATGTTMSKISSYGYKAAVGLEYPYEGQFYIQGPRNLFYLSRIEIPYTATLDEFRAVLPWQDPIN